MHKNGDEHVDIPELKTDFLFRRRPMAIPGDLRPSWKIGLIVLWLKTCCRGGRTSLARLHVLSWGTRTEKSRSDLQAAIKGDLHPTSIIVRFDPFLNRSVDFAIGEGLIQRSGSKIELTLDGQKLAEELEQINSVYVSEKKFISEIRQSVTETLVNNMFGWKE
jgi:hypothetical protein